MQRWWSPSEVARNVKPNRPDELQETRIPVQMFVDRIRGDEWKIEGALVASALQPVERPRRVAQPDRDRRERDGVDVALARALLEAPLYCQRVLAVPRHAVGVAPRAAHIPRLDVHRLGELRERFRKAVLLYQHPPQLGSRADVAGVELQRLPHLSSRFIISVQIVQH